LRALAFQWKSEPVHLLLIHQAFASPNEPGGTRHFELLRWFVAAGHRATVITSDVSYLTHKKSAAAARETIGGLDILRLPSPVAVSGSDFMGRAAAQLRFAWQAFKVGQTVPDVDLVYGTSPPMFQAVAARALAASRRVPFLFEVRDLWPAFAIEMGVLRNPFVISVAERVERWLYRNAQTIIVNSPGFTKHIREAGVGDESVRVVANGVDARAFDPASTGAEWRERLAPNGGVVVLYSGALGAANGLDTILDAAKQLRNRSDITCALVGDGGEASRLRARAQELKLDSLVILDAVPKGDMKELLAAADICVATLLPLPMFATVYPNKVFDYFAAGRPTVSNIQGPIAGVIRDSGGGITVEPGDAGALAAAVTQLANDPQLRKQMGRMARSHVTVHFDRRIQALHFQETAEETLESFQRWDARRWSRTAKRGLDLVISGLGLAVFSPVILVLAVLIRVKLGRPVTFAQRRIGLRGRPFAMVKFRSMTDARDASGTLLPDEKRLTRFGEQLRRWSLDELLQLINVLRGEMTIVGPRPLPEAYRARYTRAQWRRHYVRPGITGWAQINGRNAVEWDARFDYDLWYLNHWSLLFDLRIMLETAQRVIGRVGISQPGRATMSEFLGAGRTAPETGTCTAVFLSVRDKATRLPGKVLADIRGEPALVRLIRRIKIAKEPDFIVLTTSVHPDDAELIELARKEGIQVFAGSEDDKLQRYLDAAREFGVNYAVVVDGDDLLVSVDHIDSAVRVLRSERADFVSQSGLPLGAASFGIKIATLAEIVAEKASSDTEVWGGYFLNRPGAKVRMIEETDPLLRKPHIRMTLDYPEDLEFFRAVFDRHEEQGELSFPEAMRIIESEPWIGEINAGVQVLYEENIRKAAPVAMKS
jgi:lipopolysaccharide/colanic/teichoic acid biosynthesis glycosyltransferase/spore coat polysaccharide biosynthesis protein SpsF (cytidylyltransferase family)